MPLSEDEVSLGDEEFTVPEDPVEQERFKHRLIAIANSLKKKQQQLQADQDLIADRWTEVLAAEEHEPERPTKSYPKRRLLPQLEEEALKPTLPAYDAADWPPRGRDRGAYQPEVQPAPRRQTNKNTKARGSTRDLRDVLENKAGHTRSIYGSRGRAPTRDDDRHTGYTINKSGRAEHSHLDQFELRSNIARHRGAAHSLCFTNEVMDHEFPEGFKPVNIESYD